MEEGTQEKNRKRKAWITSVGVQVFLLALFYFLVAWREPNPPNPEFGIELNFGQQQTGQGSTPVSSPVQEETNEPEEAAPETSELSPNETLDESNDPDPVEAVENPNADVVQKESATSSTKVNETPKVTDKPADKTTNPSAVYTGDPNESEGETGETGDQGDPEGEINDQAVYTGNPGGGQDGGPKLDLAGWQWDSPPDPDDTSDEAGKIVFEITVDSDGYITNVEKKISTVSPQVTLKYRQSIELLTFTKTSTYKPAPSSKGLITFIIRAK